MAHSEFTARPVSRRLRRWCCGGAVAWTVLLGSLTAVSPTPSVAGPAPVDNRCQAEWLTQLETDPATPAPYMNDVAGGYAELFFQPDPRIKFVLRGTLPVARFVGFQTYDSSSEFGSVSALFDYQLQMDPGSAQPYVPGVAIDATPREYTIELLPAWASATHANVLRYGDGKLQVLMVRFYAPSAGVTITPADLPEIRSYYAATGRPAPCPPFASVPSTRRASASPEPEPGTDIVFQLVYSKVFLPNAAIPSYLAAHHHLAPGQVAVIRFKAPTFANTYEGTGEFPAKRDVRYWSISVGDPASGYTVAGLPDYLAGIDEGGVVTVVVGRSSEVQAETRRRGHNFILDQRDATSTSVVFVYRNVLPDPGFWSDPSAYPAGYLPTGRICPEADYLAGGCQP